MPVPDEGCRAERWPEVEPLAIVRCRVNPGKLTGLTWAGSNRHKINLRNPKAHTHRRPLCRLLLQQPQLSLCSCKLLAERLGLVRSGRTRGACLLQLSAQHVCLCACCAAVAQHTLEAVHAPLFLARCRLLRTQQLCVQPLDAILARVRG